MTELPPLMRDQRKVDANHLKLIGIFHFVLAGIAAIGLGFVLLHWWFMDTVLLSNPEVWKAKPNQTPPPKEFITFFKLMYLFMGSFIGLAAIANVISGILILKRLGRVFSLIVAGFNCLGFPFGTTLGVFTFIVLLRDSVVEAYGEAESGKL